MFAQQDQLAFSVLFLGDQICICDFQAAFCVFAQKFHPKRLHDLLPLLLDKVLCDWVLFLGYKGKEHRSTGSITSSAVWS